MTRRYVLVLALAGNSAALGLVMLAYGWERDDVRHMIVGAATAVASVVSGLVVWAYGRMSCLVEAYRAGYRHGRRDANAQLLDDGLWLAGRAGAPED